MKNNNNSIFPYRKLFGKKQLVAVKKVFERSWKLKQDHGYNDSMKISIPINLFHF